MGTERELLDAQLRLPLEGLLSLEVRTTRAPGVSGLPTQGRPRGSTVLNNGKYNNEMIVTHGPI